MKKIITALLAVCTTLLLVIPAFASEEIKCGFVMRNIGPDPVTVTITDLETKKSEEVVLQGREQKTKEYAFTEPQSVRYLLEDNASPEKHSYTVELFVETDEEGNLTGYTAAWITGNTVKPEEMLFGTRPPAVKTGDTRNTVLYIMICAGAAAAIAAMAMVIPFHKKKTESNEKTSEE